MSDELHTFDPDGDVLLLFRNPLTKQDSSHATNTNGQGLRTPDNSDQPSDKGKTEGVTKDMDTSNLGEDPVMHIRMLASSRHLMLASPVFKAMLQQGNFAEGLALQSHGKVEVPLPEDDSDSFIILLNIIHGRLRLVPHQISLSQLTTISVIADKYQMCDTVGILSDFWIKALIKDIPTTMSSTNFYPWLCISWVFGRAVEFKNLTRIAQLESESPLKVSNLPIPDHVIGKKPLESPGWQMN